MPNQLHDIRDKKSFLESSKGAKSKGLPTGNYTELLRAQPLLETLTGNSEWDLYLSCCQFFLSRAEAQKIVVDIELSDSDTWNAEKLIRLKAQSMCLGERIFTLQQCMTLPQRIIEDGEQVLEFLKKEDQEKNQE